ncbi:hypothetical protein [Paenirhodobacter populi]|uniref:Uncharacterized protein n=1 Tax=Paenirhodobacter populi TaxID=2306993 RepID=A0A443J7G5_9RHOB|nr:hypothetical protein [Sinirhodobacter populi]RWR16417.1 hypothetical protein D2T30_21740 [Sinirhodobacter populi]
MSNHSTEELKRQYDAAMSRSADATAKMYAAKARWEEAACADKIAEFEAAGGVVGMTRVRIMDQYWGGSGNPCMMKGPFVVTGAKQARYGHDQIAFTLAKLKKDGSVSSAACGEYPSRVAIIPEDQPEAKS